MLLSPPGPKHGCRNAHGIVHLPINRRFARAASALATAEDERAGTLATKWDKAETGLLRGLFSAGRRRRCLVRGRSESHRTLGVWCPGDLQGSPGKAGAAPTILLLFHHSSAASGGDKCSCWMLFLRAQGVEARKGFSSKKR